MKSYGFVSLNLIYRENILSSFFSSEDIERSPAIFFFTFTSVASKMVFSLGLERSEVLRFNGVLDIKGFFCFILSFANEISSESEVDAMNASHDSLHLADGGGLQDGLQVLVERIATAFQSVAGG